MGGRRVVYRPGREPREAQPSFLGETREFQKESRRRDKSSCTSKGAATPITKSISSDIAGRLWKTAKSKSQSHLVGTSTHERAKDAAWHPPGEKVNHLDVVPPSIKPDLHAPCEVTYLHK
uniref:Uncharacterized protein n=1 Tax=Vespula pensylvanica TaxID=30213 RepID=A0A834PGM3_VESPE|nr:hypothetical protein H0235_001678 [Vespula pensylvanica]